MKAFALLVMFIATATCVAYCQGRFDEQPKVRHERTGNNDFEILRGFDRGSGYTMFNGVFGF